MKVAYLLINAKAGKVMLVLNSLKKLPEVKEAYPIYGRFDIIAKLEVADEKALDSIYRNKISIIEFLAKSETLITMDYSTEPEEPTIKDNDDEINYEI